MFWVIFGHLFSIRLKYDVNIAGLASNVEKFFYVFVTGGFLAVDVFFFVGGFLVAYSFMREKSKSLLKYPMAVLHRLLRFWPSYIMVILLYYSVQIHTSSGPIWDTLMTIGQVPDCQGGWKALLFIDNLVDNGEHMCLPWGWYLQNDMQIFVFSLFFIMLYMKNRIAGYVSLISLIILGLALNIYEVVDREIRHPTHLIDFVKWQEYFTNIYIKPWIRCPPYVLGLVLGLLHMEYLAVRKQIKDEPENEKLKGNFFVKLRTLMLNKRWVSWISQLLGLALMITTVVLPHDMQIGHIWPYWAHGVYLAFEKVTFTFGIYLLVLPSLLEIPNISFQLLDTKFFNFTGKISFWVYLIHFFIVERVCWN
jgi:peptidoglycan/LPS O-acetylase OafA/YrhL